MDDKDLAQALHMGGSPKPGEIYRHYKGGLYSIVARAIKEDTLEPLVIYRSNAKGSVWARTLANFTETIEASAEGRLLESCPRFARVTD